MQLWAQDNLQHLSPTNSVQVLDLIHSLEVVNSLMADGARRLTDWAWSKQLRYYSAGSVLGDSGSMPGRACPNRKEGLADG